MRREDIDKLIGGYATGSLTPAEREALFAAALEDQDLFDQLAREEPLRQALSDPGARAFLLDVLAPVPWYRRAAAWWGSPTGLRVAIAAAALMLIAIVGVQYQATRQRPALITEMRRQPARPFTPPPAAAPSVPSPDLAPPPRLNPEPAPLDAKVMEKLAPLPRGGGGGGVGGFMGGAVGGVIGGVVGGVPGGLPAPVPQAAAPPPPPPAPPPAAGFVPQPLPKAEAAGRPQFRARNAVEVSAEAVAVQETRKDKSVADASGAPPAGKPVADASAARDKGRASADASAARDTGRAAARSTDTPAAGASGARDKARAAAASGALGKARAVAPPTDAPVASASGARETVRVTAQSVAVVSGRVLGLGCTVERRTPQGVFAPVDPATTFLLSDQVRLVFEPETTGHLYVLHRESGGEWRLLTGEPVEAGAQVTVPRGGALAYAAAGPKEFYAVLSQDPEPVFANLQPRVLEERLRGRESVVKRAPGQPLRVTATGAAPQPRQVALPFTLTYR